MTEERRRADDGRLDQILAHLQRQDELLDAKLAPVNKMLEALNADVNGNGKEGLKIKVDRLEQSQKTRTWALAALAAPVFAGIGKAIWEFVKKAQP